MTQPRCQIRLVLVAPRTAGNVGACARLAANFDVSDWVVVDPQCDWRNWEAKKLATGNAGERLEQIRVVATLQEAVSDCQVAVGFSRRLGRTRVASLDLSGLVELSVRMERVALVFGNEETGLTRDELESCSHLSWIPTEAAMGSMNLSHAVAVVLARLYEGLRAPASRASSRARAPTPARLREFSAMIAHWREFLIDAGMDRAGNPDRILVTLKHLLERAAPSAQEIRALRGVLSKAQVRLGTRRRGRRVDSQPPEEKSR